LGLSLGIDLTPRKVCDFDCVYCQCGKTTIKTVRRKPYFPGRRILKQVRNAIRDRGRIDFLTFSGSGEPTLNSGIGCLIKEIKKFTAIPVAVITNGSLLYRPAVRRALRSADVVLPTLCAASPAAFNRVNRPHRAIKIRRVIQGLAEFRKSYPGKIWLEVMLVRGLNDSALEIQRLKKAIRKINPDRVHLNTVVRPPSERSARPVPLAVLRKIKKMLGPNCAIVAEFGKKQSPVPQADLKNGVIEIIRRRPETAPRIARSLGADRGEVIKVLTELKRKKRIRIIHHRHRAYYQLV
jgi:wyosine [tRNA(Phe)-imidazoG37] synthetase (radical SAM superfamily)